MSRLLRIKPMSMLIRRRPANRANTRSSARWAAQSDHAGHRRDHRRGHLRRSPGRPRRCSAGPAVVISYIIAGITCAFAGLCYAEFASIIPIAGSAYTYGYATLGELVAWIIGWDLVLEYAFGAATVAVGLGGISTVCCSSSIYIPPQFTALRNAAGVLSRQWLRHVAAAGVSARASACDGACST